MNNNKNILLFIIDYKFKLYYKLASNTINTKLIYCFNKGEMKAEIKNFLTNFKNDCDDACFTNNQNF